MKNARYPLLFACLFLSLSAVAATEAPADNFPHPDSPLLTSDQRRALYLEFVENFVGWAESTGKFNDSNAYEPDGGYFEAAGKGVAFQRGNSNMCIATAVLLREFPDRQHFSPYRIDRSVLLDHLRRTIRTLCLSNKHCSRHVAGPHDWAGPAWQAAFWFTGCAWATHLTEKSLDADTLALVAEVLATEADNLDKPIPNAKPGNTASEDCTWNAPLLAFAANKLADDPLAAKWDELAKRWTVNAYSTPADKNNTELVDGKPVKDWVASANLFPDLTLENHRFWSVPYQFAYELLSEAELAYLAFGRPVPEAFAFRAEQMWSTINGVLSLWDGDILFPHGQDWAWKDFQHLAYFAWQSTCRQNPAAGAFESRALQMLIKRQRTIGSGEIRAYDFGYQSHLAKRASFAALAHEFSPPSNTLTFDQAEAPLLGVHRFPYVRTAIHRTREKLVSVSWHRRSPAVFILPEGSSTFFNPPFFVAYDRDTTVPTVTVKTPELATEDASDKNPLAPSALFCQPFDNGAALKVIVKRPLNSFLTQYTTVLSLPGNAAIYATAFHTRHAARVEISPLCAMRFAVPPGFTADFQQHRGTNWLNLTDHLAFVAAGPLSNSIPLDGFALTDSQTLDVAAGQWFSPAAVVVYTRQPWQKTRRLAEKVETACDLPNKKWTITIHDTDPPRQFDLFPAEPK